MNSRPGPLRIGAAVLALSIGLSTPAYGQPPAGAASAGSANQPAGQGGPATRQVTLISGDRVTLTGGDLARASVDPGPDRRHITFRMLRSKGELIVIPSDLAADIAAGKLDRRLFDIGGLVEAGYDDSKTATIPLIVQYGTPAARSAPVGAAVSRNLPAINGSAVKVAKKDTATFLKGLTAARSAGVTKVWLDGKRRPTLDRSVAQIGAPTAWAAGYTGKDVPVAVLDSGIDSTHPDLADRLAGSKNFTDGPAEDRNGHGTHVASTIAGTAAASDGKYRGVAPGAKVYAGKVCEYDCAESAILAGMEWAATEVRAKVVNLSLGGQDGPELDPLEEAVNRLTEQTGTLFVIAAGNAGPDARTVSSPGSAESALTVGAVDKQDKLADFSSRGPRVGDGGIKPDVTAPGVGIVAARAGGGGEPYQALSGTSMATPHVAGAAALLAQQHPDWKAAELKAALMASARPLDGLTPFEQGSGRIDVAQAIRQTVQVEPGNLSFGVAQWPHADDKPVTKQLTYRNLGDQPVDLDLTATLTGPDGRPAPDTALELSAAKVTIPAGGSSTVDVTSDTRHDGPDAAYIGRVTATGDGVTLNTSVTVTKEVESYTLTINQLGPDGKPSAGDAIIYGHDDDSQELVLLDGSVQRRVPKGRYLIDSYHIVDPWTDYATVYQVVQPNLAVTADTTVTMDNRQAKPFDVTVPAADADPMLAEVYYRLPASPTGRASDIIAFDPKKLRTAQVGPPPPAGLLTSWFSSQWAKADAVGNFDESPYVYNTLNLFPTGFPTGLTRRVQPGDLAVVDQAVHHTSHPDGVVRVSGLADGFDVPTMGRGIDYRLPAKRRLHLEPGSAEWSTEVLQYMPGYPGIVARAVGPWTSYPAGRATRDRVNVAAFTPTPLAATRSDDQLTVRLSPTTDATGARGATVADSQSSRLLRDGAELARSDTFARLDATGLPPEPAKYTLESTLVRSSTATFSTKVDARWTFTSSAAQKNLPLLGVRYHPTVDTNNTAARTPITVLPLTVDPPPGVALPPVRTAVLRYSADDGLTWRKATLQRTKPGQYRAIFPTPQSAKTVSLKLQLTDVDGNTADLTTIAAYHLR